MIVKRLFIVILCFIFQYYVGFSLNNQIIPGAESTNEYIHLLKDKRVGIVANHTSVIKNVHLVDTLISLKINVVKIFCPEHGFRGEKEAGEKVKSEKDKKTNLPIISLYGKHYKPTSEDLKRIDIILFDIQDVGVRCYTYLSTLHYVMEACAENNITLIILDRPNPNGFYIDGPVLNLKYKSFVGLHPVPLVYGMTIGEYATMINGEKWLNDRITCNLKIILCKNYTHSSKYILPVKPSPNLIDMQAVYLYPSLALFEGTAISVGRGTDKPFKSFGHPSLLRGEYFFVPQKNHNKSKPLYCDTTCRGYDLSNFVFNDSNYFTIKWLIMAYQAFPDKRRFFNRFFYNLSGNDILIKQIEDGVDENEIRKTWKPEIEKFMKLREKYLLYP